MLTVSCVLFTFISQDDGRREEISKQFIAKVSPITEEELPAYKLLCCRVTGLHCVLITDRDGVPLVRVIKDHAELGVKPSFLATFATATDQASKLGLGRNRNIINVYSNYQVSRTPRIEPLLTNSGNILSRSYK